MEYNPDINQKSCRDEWCVIAYNGNYYPNLAAYALEMNWLVASGAIIADMVSTVFQFYSQLYTLRELNLMELLKILSLKI